MKSLKIAGILAVLSLFSSVGMAQVAHLSNSSATCTVAYDLIWQSPCSGPISMTGSHTVLPGTTMNVMAPVPGYRVVGVELTYIGGGTITYSTDYCNVNGGLFSLTDCSGVTRNGSWDNNNTPPIAVQEFHNR